MNKLLTKLLKASLLTFFLIICFDAFPSTYYFSSTLGDDSRSSAQAQNQNTPWRSIQKLNSIFSSLQPGDNIMFRSGDTFHGTLFITKSGTAGAPISFGSYGSGEKPVLTGFREIKDWVSIGGNVYEAYIPEVSSSVSTVVIDDVLQAMGRYPNDNAANSGYLTINSSSWGTISSSGLQAPTSMTGGEIVIRKNNWIIDRHSINWHGGGYISYNTSGSSYSPRIGYGFFIQNHPATLDKHGEWYYNKGTKKMMIYFQGDPSRANIRVSTVDRVINTQSSASHIKFNNLTIEGSNENLINVDKSSYFSIENCQLEYVGKFAINAVMSRNLNLSNSQISNALNGGINLGWDNRTTVVRNNTFRKIFEKPGMGQNSDSQGNGIFMSENTSDALVEFNEFFESGSNAIYFNGNNISVKNNFIDTFCFVKDDGGGIYTFAGYANTTFSNRKVTNNIIVNGIGATDGTKGFGANDFPYVEGIYLDLFSNGVDIDQNTIANVKSKGIFVNNARNVSITNNRIFNAGYSIFIARDHTNNLTRNINIKNNEFLNKDSNQIHIYVRSKDNSVGQIGAFESNVYSRPAKEDNTFRLETPGRNGFISLQSWKDTYWIDRSSSNSPVTYDSDKMELDEFILFEYNYSNSSKSIPLSGTYVDLKGKIISGSVAIPAYSSIFLLKTEASTTPENVSPTVSITAPGLNSQFLQGDNLSITANATDSDGTISKVEFYQGNTLLGTDTSAPYSYVWNNLPIGSFSISVKATDNKGTAKVSEIIKISVNEKSNIAPLVSITAPGINSQFISGDDLTINANATDADGSLTKVEFYQGNTLLGTDTSAPYSFAWTNVPLGSFSLTAKATDNKGTATVSEVIKISVAEKVNVVEKVSVAEKEEGSYFGGKAAIIPGTVEAENYNLGGQGVGYFDVDARNNGGVYRTDGVDIETASEGGYNIGWMNPTEWLDYTVNITSEGAYDLDLRVSSPAAGGTFHIECNGIDVTGPLTVPATGGWRSWASVKKTGVILPAGIHTLRYVVDKNGANGYFGNLNSMNFTLPNQAPTISITAPGTNSPFTQGDNLSITVNATDVDGTITKVEFYQGNTLLGTETSTPYSYTWTNLPLGSFSITAKATDNKGTATVSAPTVINVREKVSAALGSGTGYFEGLIAFYEMNTNLSGVLRDSHGQNHGTSELINNVDGFIANGNKYDGESSISIVPHSNSLNLNSEFTLMADVFREGDGQHSGSLIIGKTLSAEWSENQTYSIAITKENKIRIRTNTPYLKDWVSSQTVPAGMWVRIIATYKSGEGYSLYLDNTNPEKSPQFSGEIIKTELDLKIGSASYLKDAANRRRFEGILDNVGIWDRKLSQGEIEKLINTKITYPEFNGTLYHRIAVSSNLDELKGNISTKTDSVEAKAGEKLVFMVETKEAEGVVFDHWSIDGLPVNTQTLFELEMPEKDITLTKNFRDFVSPEITITLPSESSEFEALSKVHIELEIKDNDAQIEKVELFNGTTLVGKLSEDSTGLNWENIPEGNHSLVARITDTEGKFYFSEQVLLKAVSQTAKDIPNARLEYTIGPNPTTDHLNVIFTNLDGIYDFELRVVSMNGRVHSTFKTRPEESTITIDVSDLINGVYILQLSSNGNSISSKKFIKH